MREAQILMLYALWDGRLQSLIALERAYNAEHNTDKSPKKHSFISAFWDYTWHPVLDALTGVIYVDDLQVACIWATKEYGARAETVVSVVI